MKSRPDKRSKSNAALQNLKRFTNARIALGRAGISQPLQAHLEFQLAHALARDAVNTPLDFNQLAQQLGSTKMDSVILQTQAENRQTYLQRPDLGKLLDQASVDRLTNMAANKPIPDIVIVIADGLSSTAITHHAAAFIEHLIPAVRQLDYQCAPLFLVQHGRVAIGDPIGQSLNARMSIVLIGERPGLSSADSLGIYFTYKPKAGKTDAERNCISNIHQHGLSYAEAITKLIFLITESDRLKLSGVHLKDATLAEANTSFSTKQKNFLLE